ncbi:MAG: hypothetical protein GY832_09775 [Chloroflexi bacterium]|nr:hypothetical protein [Chloroflexota bacterium]
MTKVSIKRWLNAQRLSLSDWAVILLLLVLIVALGVFAVHAAKSVSHRYPLDYGEAPLVNQAMHLADGQNIYRRNLSEPPYTISNYPPLYVLSMAPFVELFGPNFWSGRAISVASALASAVFIALIVHSQTKDWLASAAAGLFLLAIPFVVYWASLARIDSLALALSLAGLYLLARWPDARWSMIASALLLLAAIYTRQSYALAAPMAAFFWLCAHNWRRAFGLVALVGGLALLLFFVLNMLTQGGFYFNIVTANVNEFGMDRLEWNLHQLRDTAFILLLLSGAFLIFAPGRMRSWPLLTPYLIGAALSGLTIGKIGSNVNYFLELCATMSLVAGSFVAWVRRTGLLRAVLPILLTMQAVQLMVWTFDEYWGPLNNRIRSVSEIRQLEDIVIDTDGPILADEYMGLLTLQGRPLVIQPFEVTQLSNVGLWDQTSLVEDIRDKEFPIILVHHFPSYPVYKERWTPEMLSAIDRSYVFAESLADTRVYRPFGSHTPSHACPGAPWQLPTSGDLGVQWDEEGLDFLGWGNENSIAVHAVADGLLTRLPGWNDGVAIQHDDPLQLGEKVWSYYTHMSNANGTDSYIVRDFPPGSDSVPVQAGQVLGYQGRWSGESSRPMWVHLRFVVLRATDDGSFPDEAGAADMLDPSPYLGIAARTETGLRPLRCQEQ